MMHSASNCVGVASLIGFLSASLPSVHVSQAPGLAWPDAFTVTGPSGEPAHQHVLDLIGPRVKLTVPQSWVVGGPNGPSIAMDLDNGRRLEIAETKPTDFNFNAPVTVERLAESIKTMQANVPAGYVVEKAGQVKIGDRLWLWHESQIPTFDTSTSALYQKMLRIVPYRSARQTVGAPRG
jgi:hypothetical protein